MSIQRWSIEDASEYYEDGTGDMVTYADHIASHAYDEAKERELFEAYASKHYRLQELPLDFDDGEYTEPETQYSWESWEACAKSRARRPADRAQSLISPSCHTPARKSLPFPGFDQHLPPVRPLAGQRA